MPARPRAPEECNKRHIPVCEKIHSDAAREEPLGIRDFKDKVYPFFESDTL